MQPLGPAWVEVDLDALGHNTRLIRQYISSQSTLMAVVKSDGYGHGALAVAYTVLRNGADWLGVSDIWEAQELRSGGIKSPVLVFTPAPQCFAYIPSLDIRQTVCDLDFPRAMAQCARKQGQIVKVHLKVDCGMGRLGVLPQDASDLAGRIIRLEGIELEGIYTHFPQGNNMQLTKKQLRVFLDVCSHLQNRGIHIPLTHAANSQVLCNLPQAHLHMVRTGTLLYGQGELKDLKSTWMVKTKPIFSKTIPTGTSVGYGGEYVAKSPTLTGVLPIGYADGLTLEPQQSLWRQGKKWLKKLIRGDPQINGQDRCLPLLGRVSMNMATIGLGQATQEPLEISLRRSVVSRRLPKIFFQGGEPVFVLYRGDFWQVIPKQGIFYLGKRKVHL